MSDVEQSISAYYSYKEKQSQNTAREYRRFVQNFKEYLDEHTDARLFDCHSGHVEGFYQWMLEDEYSPSYAPSGVRKAHSAISDFFKKLEKFGGKRGFPDVEVDNPAENATPERIDGMFSGPKTDMEGGKDPLTPEEVRQLVDNVPPDNPVRNELIIRLLYQTGVRRSELVRIKLSHIDRDDRRITIYGKKTEESRNVWYKRTLDTLLDLWIEGDRNAVFYAEESDYLFPTVKSERMSGQTVTSVVTEAAERAGMQETIYKDRAGDRVTRVTPHTLRKTFGVQFIKSGGDISFLMELLGHNDIETTKENYLAYVEQDLRESANRYGPSL